MRAAPSVFGNFGSVAARVVSVVCTCACLCVGNGVGVWWAERLVRAARCGGRGTGVRALCVLGNVAAAHAAGRRCNRPLLVRPMPHIS